MVRHSGALSRIQKLVMRLDHVARARGLRQAQRSKVFWSSSSAGDTAAATSGKKTRRYHGVTTLLERMFGRQFPCSSSSAASRNRGGGGGKKASSARRRGVRVHAQLRRLAERIALDDDKLAYTSPLTRRIWRHVTGTLRWQPVAGEVICVADNAGIGTAADMVCVCTRTGHAKLLEVKTGYAGSKYRSGSNSAATIRLSPSVALVDSPYVRHSMQLVETARLFSETYGVPLRRRDIGILRADDEGVVELLPVAPSVWKNADLLHSRAAAFLEKAAAARRGGVRGVLRR